MPKLRTYYEILDVAIDADEAAIRRAYRKAAAAHHPDRDNYSPRSQKRIRELNTARETLLDEKRRAKYDKQLKKMGIIPDDPVEDIEPVKETGSSDSDFTNYANPPETQWRTQDQPTSTGSSTEFEEYNPTPEPQNWDTASDFSSRQSFGNQAFKTKTGTFVKKPIRRKRKKLGKSLLLFVSLPLGGISGISVAILILWLGFQMDPLGLFDSRFAVQNAEIKEVLELEPEQEETREPVESIPRLPKTELVDLPDDQRESPSQLSTDESKSNATNKAVTLKGHLGRVSSVAFSPDGNSIASGGGRGGNDTTVKIWDAKTGKEKLTLKGHTYFVSSVAFSPDGNSIASGSDDRTVKIWDAKTGKEKLSLEGYTGFVRSVAFSPDRNSIATGSVNRGWEGVIKIWDAKTGKEKLTFKGHADGVCSVAFSPDGNSIATGGGDGGRATVKIWDAKTGKEKLTLKGRGGGFSSVAFSPDGNSIATPSGDGGRATVKIWDAKTGKEKLTLKGYDTFLSVGFSPDGNSIATGSADKTVKIWDAKTGKEKLTLKGHADGVYSVAFSPDGNSIASGSRDRTVKIWNLKAAEQLDSERKNAPVEDPSSASKPDPKPIKSLPKSFNSATAKRFQKAWADKLNIPVKTKNSIGMEFVLIPPGSFSLNDLKPWKKNAPTSQGEFFRGMESSIDQPFYISTTEVTQSAYESLVRQNPSKQKGLDLPVEQVSFQDCVKFCRLLSELENEQYTLPTEEEWEFSALSGQSNPLFWRTPETLLDDYVWHRGNSGIRTREVATKRPNQFGLFDTLGNVNEWCVSDNKSDDKLQVFKGNSAFDSPGLYPFQPGARRATKDDRYYTLGFRVIRQLPKHVLKELE